MTAWFLWVRGKDGPQPQLIYGHLPADFNPEKKNSRAYVAHELSEETKAVVKATQKSSPLDVLAQMFPKPRWPEE